MKKIGMCKANIRILPLFLLLLYLSLGILTDFLHNHPIGSQRAPAQSCAACNWIQTSRTNLTIVPCLPGPIGVFFPVPFFQQIFLPQTFGEIPRLRSPPLTLHQS